MKWSKFQNFVTEHLFLGEIWSWHIFPGAMTCTAQEWVEQRVKYVAVRPWESLDMNLTGSHSSESRVEYTSWFHIENDDTDGALRLRSASSGGDNMSVIGLFRHLKQWHGEYWGKQENCPLVHEAIIRKTSEWSEEDKLGKVSLEIFIPPHNFMQ